MASNARQTEHRAPGYCCGCGVGRLLIPLAKRVERVVRYSARVGKSKLPGPVGRFFRDLMMPVALKLYAAMAQTDCTACGYDCEGYAVALSNGKEKDPNLCVPGKEETAQVVKDLLKGTGLPAASG